MLKNLKTVTKGSLVYGFGNISIKLVGLILIPIYTNENYLSVSDFGVVGIIDITSQFLVSLLSLSLSQALTRWYWEKDAGINQKILFFSVFVLLTLVAVLTSVFFTIFSDRISLLLFDSNKFGLALSLMMISSAMQILISLLQTLMKIQQKPVLFTVTNIAKLIITLLLTIIFVVYQHKNIEGIYQAQIYGSILFFIITAPYFLRNIEFNIDFKTIRVMLVYSFPLILASTSAILISILDKYILNYLATRNEVSVYIFAFRMANSIKIFIIASVQMAVSPLLFQIINDPQNKRFYSKYMTYFSLIVMIGTIILSVFSYEIVHIFATSTAYYAAWTIIPILCFAIFFGMLKDTASTGLQISKKTGIISIITILCTIINVALNYLLIPSMSYYGAALSFLFSQFLFFVLMYFYSQKGYPIPYELKKIILISLIGLVYCLSTYFLNDLSFFIRILIKVIMIGMFPVILFPFNFYEDIEIKRLKEAWLKWKKPQNWLKNLKKSNMDF